MTNRPRTRVLIPAATLLALGGAAWWALRPPPTMAWSALTDRPRPTGAIRIAYGPDPLQIGDLWLPPRRGPGASPVVLMIHGGCWQTAVADRTLMDWAAADLAARGIAVWNIDYRGGDRPGGGYPGTFLDVARAADRMPALGAQYRLRTDRIVAVGHSAGGHLALWLAARARLPAGGALTPAGRPLALHAVIGLGALPDLAAARDLPGNDCGATGVPLLVGPATAARPDPMADTSIPRLLPLGVPQTLVTGARDRTAPTRLADGYAAQARAAGDPVRTLVMPGAGHVELIAPGTAAWTAQVALIRAALGLR